jgi:hypothetical protein
MHSGPGSFLQMASTKPVGSTTACLGRELGFLRSPHFIERISVPPSLDGVAVLTDSHAVAVAASPCEHSVSDT